MIITNVGNLEVIDNKVVHVTKTSQLSINIDRLTLIIDFSNDKNEFSKVSKEVVNDTTLRIVCNSFNNPLGEGILEPIEIGTLEGKKMYLSFFVWTPDLSFERRVVNYCLYLEKK